MPAISASIIFPSSTIDFAARDFSHRHSIPVVLFSACSLVDETNSCNALPDTKIKIRCYIVAIAHLISSVFSAFECIDCLHPACFQAAMDQ